MFVQSNDSFNRVGNFDPRDGSLLEFERNEAPQELLSSPLAGHFAALGESEVVFFRQDDQLSLSVDGEIFPLLEGVKLEWENSHGLSRIRLRDGDSILRSIEYTAGPASYPPIEEDPTPFVEREDWDFGLFVHAVLEDSERSERIYLTAT
jgi:hypothetical protein